MAQSFVFQMYLLRARIIVWFQLGLVKFMISVKFRIEVRVSFRLVNIFRVKVMVKVRNLCFYSIVVYLVLIFNLCVLQICRVYSYRGSLKADYRVF